MVLLLRSQRTFKIFPSNSDVDYIKPGLLQRVNFVWESAVWNQYKNPIQNGTW